MFRLALAATLLFGPATLALAQTNVGRISGTVTDPADASVAAAQVTAVNPHTGRQFTAETDASGTYVFPSLESGVYDIRAEREGFRSAIQQAVVLDAAGRRTVDFKLQIGAVADSVSVTASAQQVQVASGEVSRIINDQQLSQIALNGRNYTQLLRLIPGPVATNLKEKARIQFRAESFNLPNHPSFTSVNTTAQFNAAGAPINNFGAVTGAGPGRILSFGLKVIF